MATEIGLIALTVENTVLAIPCSLNLGCGRDYRNGWHNVDISPEVKADQYFNAFEFPWNLPDAHFEEVLVSHLVEHVPHQILGAAGDGFYIFFEEIYRILMPGGVVRVIVPWWKHPNSFIDQTHTRIIHPKAFDFFNPTHPNHYQTQARFTVSASRARREDRISRYLRRRLGIKLPGLRKVELGVILTKV